MKLVLYSGGHAEDNLDVDAQLLRMLGKANPRITFIPSCYEDTDEDYHDFFEHFSPHGIAASTILHADRPINSYDLSQALAADMVYLSGGNTFYFLETLRENRFLTHLKRYAQSGNGVLAGVSAGAILMTPTIDTAGFPEFDRDENHNNLTNLRAMGLVPFDFFPHYLNKNAYDREFTKFSVYSGRPLFACQDGSGIIVQEFGVNFVGNVAGFVNGKKFILSTKK